MSVFKDITKGMADGAEALQANFAKLAKAIVSIDDTTGEIKLGDVTVNKLSVPETATLTSIKTPSVKTGSTKLGGLTINFRQTVVGVDVYMDGSFQGSFGTSDGYTISTTGVPDGISYPRQNVVLTIVSNSGVSGVTSNSPWKLEVLIGTDGKIKYRAKNLRDNDTATRSATIVGADSTFYALD